MSPVLSSDALDLATAMAAIADWIRATSGLDQEHVWWPYYGKPRPTAPYIEVKFASIEGVGHDWEKAEDNIQVFPAEVVSAVAVNPANTLTITGHPFVTGDGPINMSTTGTLPAPLQVSTDYWIIVIDANTIQLAESYVETGGNNVARGMGNTPNPITPIVFTTTGTGIQSIVSTPETLRAGQEIVRRAQGFRYVTLELQCIGKEGTGIDPVRILTNVIAGIQLHVYDLDQAGVGMSDFGSAYSQTGVRQLEGRRGSILEPRAVAEVVTVMTINLTAFDTIIEEVDAELDLTTPGGDTIPPIPLTFKV